MSCRRTAIVAGFVTLTLSLPGRAAEKARTEDVKGWLARPAEVEAKILSWAEKCPDLVSLETEKTRGGHTAYAVTVTSRKTDDAKKRKLLFCQPHAHEPATTAGMMDVLAELLDGAHLDGRPADFDRRPVLDAAVLSFVPIGNPDGLARAPEDFWDGKKYSNEEFLQFAFGRTAEGKRCPRVGRWSIKEQRPARIGIVYEQISEDEYVEPNRDPESTYFKLLRRLLGRRSYDLLVDLHQTEFERSDRNCMILLPFSQKQLPERIRATNEKVGQAAIAAWQRMGASPIPQPQPLAYGEDQLRYFRRCWGEIYQTTPCINVEVQNNNVRTPPEVQMRLIEASIRASVEFREQ